MPNYFVWVQGLNGPEPQLWHDEMPQDGNGKLKVKPLFGPIAVESDNLSQLIKDHPYVDNCGQSA